MKEFTLKYGCNPHQKPAKLLMKDNKELPFTILNGKPGYINFMDALNSWQLVKELKEATNMPSAASFKHVSPAGAAIGTPLSEDLKKACQVEGMDLTPMANAYAKARGADRMSSFGDWAAMSDTVDKETALILKREVSDGVIAPDYTDEALKILKEKRNGNYNVIKMDTDYIPEEIEQKDIFGVILEQKRNDAVIGSDLIGNIVTAKKEIPESAKLDMLISLITLKYTQSNSVCYAYDGQAIGVGAGQQSRIHCTRLAGSKADIWYLRQHPKVLGLKFKETAGRPERDNTIDQYLRDDITEAEMRIWQDILEEIPDRLTASEKADWLKGFSGVSLGSDAFFPFRDNIDRANMSGVKFIVQPGGSVRDDIVIDACNEYGIVMACNGLRLFHH
jgi:phosphoribosylaminoimidazolecarboxamide formyltransferase/IMP cyclohydrolase